MKSTKVLVLLSEYSDAIYDGTMCTKRNCMVLSSIFDCSFLYGAEI